MTTCACSACLSGESPKSCTRSTPGIARIVASSVVIVWMSAGIASRSACDHECCDAVLRVPETAARGSRPGPMASWRQQTALRVLGQSERPGNALTETIVITTHATTIGQRKRTEKFPIPAKPDWSPGPRDRVGRGCPFAFMPRIVHAMKFSPTLAYDDPSSGPSPATQESKPSPAHRGPAATGSVDRYVDPPDRATSASVGCRDSGAVRREGTGLLRTMAARSIRSPLRGDRAGPSPRSGSPPPPGRYSRPHRRPCHPSPGPRTRRIGRRYRSPRPRRWVKRTPSSWGKVVKKCPASFRNVSGRLSSSSRRPL